MTLEKLIGGDADYLESLSDKELKEFFAPYLTVTRPSPEQEKLRKVREISGGKKLSKRDEAMSKLERLWKEKMGTEFGT